MICMDIIILEQNLKLTLIAIITFLCKEHTKFKAIYLKIIVNATSIIQFKCQFKIF